MYSLCCFKIFLQSRVNFIFRRNPKDRSCFFHAKPFGIHDDLQSLIPGHVFEPQGKRTSNSIRSYNIKISKISNYLQ